jgi:hypothetical protein
MDVKKGQKYWYRWVRHTSVPDLRVEVVRDVVTLGDGTTIVRHSEPTLFGFLDYPVDDTLIDVFIKNAQLIE